MQFLTQGLFPMPFWGYVVFTLVMTQITVLAVTLYLHRCQAHRALELHPIVSHFFRFWLWLTSAQNTKEWTAVHRKHHARCETEDDPHSPQVQGLRKVMLEGAELYRDTADQPEVLEKYGKGTPDDWMERNIYNRFKMSGILLMFLIDVVCFGAVGITIWAIQMMFMPVFAAGVINGVGHYYGYRNFECPDAATNIVPWGLFLGGEELHNNHHTYATSAKFSVKKWEFDIGWMVICVLRTFGLAKVKRVPPKLELAEGRDIDRETIKAVITNRFQLLSTYSKEVIMPVIREEKRLAGVKSKRLYKRAAVALTRHQLVIKDADKERLTALLENSQSLQVVHDFQEKLKDLWQKTSSSTEELVHDLREWCVQAEKTGIKSLQDFAMLIRSQVPQTA